MLWNQTRARALPQIECALGRAPSNRTRPLVRALATIRNAQQVAFTGDRSCVSLLLRTACQWILHERSVRHRVGRFSFNTCSVPPSRA
jgi:hypothetical protein